MPRIPRANFFRRVHECSSISWRRVLATPSTELAVDARQQIEIEARGHSASSASRTPANCQRMAGGKKFR
jgi:hypothetical protein